VDPLVKLARVPSRPPVADVLLAAALLLWALLEVAFQPGPSPTWGRIVFAVVVTVPLAVRRQAPGVVVAIVAVAIVAWSLHANEPESGTMPFPSVLLAAFSVAVYARRPAVAVAGGAALLGAMLLAVESAYYPGSPNASNLAILSLFLGGAWAAGWLVRQRAAQARHAVEESGDRARQAVDEERARIARELHDAVAHSVSIIAVQAGAAEELIERDPAQAREHMAAVRRTSREAMAEMRRLLDVLRADEPGYAPQPGLARLPDLLDEVRDAGVPVELVEDGERPHLPPGLDLVVFRVVQESLTNVRKHAPGASARVALRYRPTAIELEVVNGPSAAPGTANGTRPGHGLIGMRERVHLFGGRIDAEPSIDGGYRVLAVLPRAEEPA
jgi:signal transduction histidine kinase